MNDYKLPESEYRFAKIVWQKGEITSKELVLECEKILGWKKSTTYTVLKRLCDKQILKNENAVIYPLVTQNQVQKFESNAVVNKTFDGSLPGFLAAFMEDKKLTLQEAEELKKLIDQYKEGC